MVEWAIRAPAPDGLAPFETTVNIVGGTGNQRSRRIMAAGLLDLVIGEALGVYEGEICDDENDER